MRRVKHSGFTLIEMMIVIAIIAILMAFIIPAYAKSRFQANLSACKQNVRNIATAIESYAADNGGKLPVNLRVLTQHSHPYIGDIPKCPVAGTSFVYESGYEHIDNPDVYSICCLGSYHTDYGLPPNTPIYAPSIGLVEQLPDE